MSDENGNVLEITKDQAAHAINLMTFADEFVNETVATREFYEKNSTLLEDIKAVDDWANSQGLYPEEDEDWSEDEADMLLIAYMQGMYDAKENWEEQQAKRRMVTVSVLYVYDSPGPHHKIIGRMVFGDKVTVYETKDGGDGDPIVWCRVTDNEEDNGWISATCLEER